MFNTVTIVGVGLIGGSFALACKEHGLAERIVGCSRKQSTLDEAIKLGLIDEGVTDVGEAVKDADLVVICTPLGSYKDLAQAMSGSLKTSVILTDAGSVKDIPSQQLLAGLDDFFHSRFVPGHPIAGTEKSGPAAAFSGLYSDKKVILTPAEGVDGEIVEKVSAVWQAIGADVELLDAKRHDFIYATVSHSVQVLSFGFGIALAKQSAERVNDVELHKDRNFEKFIRLCGSDIAMWRDIFTINKVNLCAAVRLFDEHLAKLSGLILDEKIDDVSMHLSDSKDKRLQFHDVITGGNYDSFRPSNYTKAEDGARVWLELLPRIISSTIMQTIAPSEYEYATGAGLHSLSKNIILQGAMETEDLVVLKSQLCAAIRIYREALGEILDAVESGNKEALSTMLQDSVGVYNRMMTS